MVNLDHQRAVACDAKFETNDKKVLWDLYPILPPYTCTVFEGHLETSVLFLVVPIVYIDGFRQMAKWNFSGLYCVSLEQEHGPPILVECAKKCAKEKFAWIKFYYFHSWQS
jgi:hypothetical protein